MGPPFFATHNNTTPTPAGKEATPTPHPGTNPEHHGKVSIGLACHPNHNHHEEVVDAEQKPHHQT